MKEELNNYDRMLDLIHECQVTMLTTMDPEGCLRSRPMSTLKPNFQKEDKTLWFFTDAESGKIFEIKKNSEVNLSYCNAEKQIYVSVSGHGELIKDHEMAAQLWSPLMKAWFPNGLEDPSLSLLKITVTKAEYWDAPSSPIVQFIGMAQAIVKGEPYQAGSHGKLYS